MGICNTGRQHGLILRLLARSASCGNTARSVVYGGIGNTTIIGHIASNVYYQRACVPVTRLVGGGVGGHRLEHR